MPKCIKNTWIFILFFISVPSLFAQDNLGNLKIKIVESDSIPVFGVYIIEKNKNTLLASTDMDGECYINIKNLNSADSLQFHGMGYKVLTYSIEDLKQASIIHFERLHYQLEAFVVKSVPYDQILKEAAKKLQKKIKTSYPYCRFYGKSQYEKITEYDNTTVEYRKEIGQYFTSGNVNMKNSWDPNYRSYFVSAFSARSFNFENKSNDTLK